MIEYIKQEFNKARFIRGISNQKRITHKMKKTHTVFLALISLIFLLTACKKVEGYTDKENTNPTSEAHIHAEEILPAVPASCTESGLSEGVRCSECHEILTLQEVVPALGHSYVDGVCTVCGHKITQGLKYSLNQDKKSYAVSGIGSAVDTDICVPDTYNGLPVTSIGYEAFFYCNNIKSIEIPNSVKSIENGAFYYCENLKSAKLPNSLTSIGISAFAHCSTLESIELPDSVKTIGVSAFEYCDKLKSVKYPSGMTSVVDNLFFHCISLTSIEIPSSVTAVGVSSFGSCTNLKSVTLPSGVKSIGFGAFSRCGRLTSIEIPDSVTKIGDDAFYGCGSLKSIVFKGTKAKWNSISKGHGWNFVTGSYTVECDDGNIGK